MIRIAISAEAFEAIAKTLPLGSVGYENAINEKGRKARLARAERGQSPQGPARPGRELQRRHFAAGGGRRLKPGRARSTVAQTLDDGCLFPLV